MPIGSRCSLVRRGRRTDASVAGLQWHAERWRFEQLGERVEVYLELEAAGWLSVHVPEKREGASAGQYSLVPVLRWRPRSPPGWFVEVGVGPSGITPRIVDCDCTFSTRFQSRDHIGVGWTFGIDVRHAVPLRLEHFSNGGVASPNPGVNFAGIRYAIRF